MDFKLLLWAYIISSNSAGSSKAKWCQSPILVLTFFFLIGVYIQNTWQNRKKECHTSYPLKQQCRHINPSMAKHRWRYPGDGIHCFHAVWDWAHPVCWHSLSHSLQIHSPCSGCCLLLLAHFHILHDRQLQEIWPSENQLINKGLLEFPRFGSSQLWAAVFVIFFLQYPCPSKEVLTVGDTLIPHMILWSVLQKDLLLFLNCQLTAI